MLWILWNIISGLYSSSNSFTKIFSKKNSGVARSGLRLDTEYLVGNIEEHYIHSSNSIGFHKYDGYDTIVYNNKNLSENNN